LEASYIWRKSYIPVTDKTGIITIAHRIQNIDGKIAKKVIEYNARAINCFSSRLEKLHRK